MFGWGVGCFFYPVFVLFLSSVVGPFFNGGSFYGSVFVLDYVSVFLSLISFLLFLSLYNWWGGLSVRCRFMLAFSVFMSFLCYCSLNAFVFWVSYELCILPLLFLLVSESSYSERFIAFWYLLGYVVLTSLPLLLSFIYLFGSYGSFVLCMNGFGPVSWGVLFVVFVCFITKIPLPPFHVWLPIVHAEASSPVSVCLSGFIMKLGVLGVFRFAFLIMTDLWFSYYYIAFIFCVSVAFLLLSSQELDGKRWLAILSLSHIVLGVLGLTVVTFSCQSIPFIYCLGHGLSAGLVFLFLWLLYDVVGSRNWNILKFSGGNGGLVRGLCATVLCTAASLPPTLSFFSEIRMIIDSGSVSMFLLLVFFCYLFFSGLMPLFILGGCLSRHLSLCSCHSGCFQGWGGSLFLIFCCYAFFLAL